MSRIQEILRKAERDGVVQRTRSSAPLAPVALDEPITPREARPTLVEPAIVPPPQVAIPAVAPPAPRRVASVLDNRLVAAAVPNSLAGEQYRLLRTRLSRSESGRKAQAIIVTSPNKGDGKSLTAANLALTIAQEFQQRIVLVDADLRRPSVHSLFGIDDTPGLSDVLMGGATLDDSLLNVGEHRLTVLPAGLVPSHPAELLGSAAMRRVLDTLRGRFDRILIDMPPVAPLADVAVASALADGVLMIVRAGVTPKPAIERALSGIDSAKVLGLVLNDAGGSRGGYDYEGYAGYVAG